MKTLRKMKKGFTIVELVIVIAVIAVLTAILVPTFISISNKADKASDQSLKDYLNKALAIVENDRELNKNGDNATMHYAVEDLDNYGISLDKIVTKSDEKLVWNQADNRFYFESQAPAAVADRLGYWRIQTNDNDDEGYSIYAAKGTFVEPAEGVDVNVGFDVGYNLGINQITFNYGESAKRTVAIRTNSSNTSLTINAPKGTVKHFGEGLNLVINSIDTSSYHENGSFQKGLIKQGRIVVENSGEISLLNVESKTADETVYVENKGEISVINTLDSTQPVDIENTGTIETAVVDPAQEISGKSSENKFTEITTLTSNMHDITSGGYYKSNGSTIEKSSDTKFALNVLTHENVVIEGAFIDTSARGILLADNKDQDTTGSFHLTVIDSTIKLPKDGRGIQIWFDSIDDAKPSEIKVINSTFVSKVVTDYETEVDSNSFGIMITNTKDVVVYCSGCTFKGIGKSFLINAYGTDYNSHVTLNVENSEMYARAGIDCVGATDNSVINISNSKIHGVNTFTGSQEGFGDIVIEKYGDGTTTLNIDNVEFEVYRAPGTAYNGQSALDIREGAVVNLVGTNTLFGDVYYTENGTMPGSADEQVAAIAIRTVPSDVTINGTLTSGTCRHTKGQTVLTFEWK